MQHPYIVLEQGKLVHLEGSPKCNKPIELRVAMSHASIRVGCTRISAEALRYLMAQHEARFGVSVTEYCLQAGANHEINGD